uniref:Homeobox domain-containing protein n=1 Tax=Anopheles epiroticus TaxID=199890 RepID=A0A182P800_9DIPT
MDKPSRPVRNRKRSRKAWPPGDSHRPVKRLFTPEIKRMLKDWLVRRRENPYPNREEKKLLAGETGLTYTQICNWFANWRRKLKNSGNDPLRKTWGNLIKNYNTNARGNVEQFSICSNDSIWGENGEESLDSRTSDSGEHPYSNHPSTANQHHHHHHHHHRSHLRHSQHQSLSSNAKCESKDDGTQYRQTYATDAGDCIGDNNNSDSCRNNNIDCRAFPGYMRVPEYGRLEDCPSSEGLRESYPPTAFRIDHCYTPRNYDTVFGLPEDTRCYKVTQFDGSYDPESGAGLEPIILTATPAHYGPTFTTGEIPNGGTLYLTPTTTLAPAVPPTIPHGRSRSSKYKSSIMEKYLRDLGELESSDEPADEPATMMPVLMATIPFQQKHCVHARSHVGLQLQAQPAISYDTAVLRGPPSLSKWLESAAKFTPSKHNYIDWECNGKQSTAKKRYDAVGNYYTIADADEGNDGCTYAAPLYGEPIPPGAASLEHQKDELDAAEALTKLANNFRTKFST